MFKKSIAFGLLAATLMVAPGAAFAQQRQSSDQFTRQDGAALDGSVNTQNSNSRVRQNQDQNTSASRRGYLGRGRCAAKGTEQDQSAVQTTEQAGVAENFSRNRQNSNTNANQRQSANTRARC